MSILESLEAILSAAEFGRTRETGCVTLESAAIRKAAVLLGYKEEITREEIRRVMRMCGFRSYSNGATGAKYVAPGHTDKYVAVEYAVAYATRVNHFEGDLHARLVSAAIPEGLSIEPRDFVSGIAARSAEDLKVTRVNTSNGLLGDPTQSEGAWVALNVKPGSMAAHVLSALPLVEHNSVDGTGEVSARDEERVSLHVAFPDGSSSDLTGGALVYKTFVAGHAQYVFHFTATNRDC
jgi:hypothetical protein